MSVHACARSCAWRSARSCAASSDRNASRPPLRSARSTRRAGYCGLPIRPRPLVALEDPPQRPQAPGDARLVHQERQCPLDRFLLRVDAEVALREVDLALVELQVLVSDRRRPHARFRVHDVYTGSAPRSRVFGCAGARGGPSSITMGLRARYGAYDRGGAPPSLRRQARTITAVPKPSPQLAAARASPIANPGAA